MVWFQCESCGENLKKPKLQNHFRGCAARKLSCIDCGVVFDQQSVQVHTSCVSETEKYGPKDGSNGSAHKPKTSQPHKGGDFDLSVGLSTGPPWNCSLCKVNATSYETLEGHSQGKKHRAKAKAAHARLNSNVDQGSVVPNSGGNGSEDKVAAETNGSESVVNGKSVPTTNGEEENAKKRKSGLVVDEGEKKVGEKIKKRSKAEELPGAAAKEGIVSSENGGGVEESTPATAQNGKPIKWKKLTTKVLLTAPEKRIKLKELLKELLPLVTLGADNFDKKTLETQLVETLNASSKFEVKGKWVGLANAA
ncbi:hypothetical protein M758_1G012500 [Ceratodon purpureus]|nr:hypothetical protein M758_1G012500 [Ceratodon purpureus]